jgi:PIN domain nuclease of toxin-antitoxin system
VWSLEAALTKEAAQTVVAAASREELLISPISAWEIGTLVGKGRLKLSMPVQDYVAQLYARRGVTVAPFTPGIALAASVLPGSLHGDPADRILVATAAALGAQLVTRDGKLQEYARLTRHIRCLPC